MENSQAGRIKNPAATGGNLWYVRNPQYLSRILYRRQADGKLQDVGAEFYPRKALPAGCLTTVGGLLFNSEFGGEL